MDTEQTNPGTSGTFAKHNCFLWSFEAKFELKKTKKWSRTFSVPILRSIDSPHFTRQSILCNIIWFTLLGNHFHKSGYLFHFTTEPALVQYKNSRQSPKQSKMANKLFFHWKAYGYNLITNIKYEKNMTTFQHHSAPIVVNQNK